MARRVAGLKIAPAQPVGFRVGAADPDRGVDPGLRQMVAEAPGQRAGAAAVVGDHHHQILADDGAHRVFQRLRQGGEAQLLGVRGGLGQQDDVPAGAVDADAGEPTGGLARLQGPVDHVLEDLPGQGALGLALLDHVVELDADQVLGVAHDPRVLEGLLHPQRARVAAAGGNREGCPAPGARRGMVGPAVVELGGELGQHDLGPQHGPEVLEEFGESAAGEQGAGQDLVAGDEPLQLGEVVRGLGVGDELADGDERRPVRHLDHRQPPAVGLGNQGRRHGVVREADPEADAHRPGALDLADEAALLRGAPEPHAGGEDQFAAVEEALRVLLLGDGHPDNVLVPGGFGEAGLREFEGWHRQQGGK